MICKGHRNIEVGGKLGSCLSPPTQYTMSRVLDVPKGMSEYLLKGWVRHDLLILRGKPLSPLTEHD